MNHFSLQCDGAIRRMRGAAAVLFTTLILLFILGALMIYAFIAWRELIAAHRVTSSTQALQGAEAAADCATAAILSSSPGTNIQQEFVDCENLINSMGMGNAIITPTGLGDSDSPIILVIDVAGVTGGARREIKRELDSLTCENFVVNGIPVYLQLDSGETPSGGAQTGEMIGFIDRDNNRIYSTGDTPLIKGRLNGVGGCGSSTICAESPPATLAIIFYPNTVVDLQSGGDDIREIRAPNIFVRGALIATQNTLFLRAYNTLDLNDGALVTNRKLKIWGEKLIRGNSKTLIHVDKGGGSDDINFNVDSSPTENPPGSATTINMKGSCIVSGNDINVVADRDIKMLDTNLSAGSIAGDAPDIRLYSLGGSVYAGSTSTVPVTPIDIRAEEDIRLEARNGNLFASWINFYSRDTETKLRWDATCETTESYVQDGSLNCGGGGCARLCP